MGSASMTALLSVFLMNILTVETMMVAAPKRQAFAEGDQVVVKRDCLSDSLEDVPLKAGDVGIVSAIDKFGNLKVAFDCLGHGHRFQWISHMHFSKIGHQVGPLRQMFDAFKASVGTIAEFVTPDSSSTVLFIGVMTAPGNVARRKEIREAWMQHEMLTKAGTPIIQSRFIVGIPEAGSDAESELALDMEMNEDILQLPTAEGYHNLPNKSVAFFRWFAEHGKAAFAMKLDDDTFPDLDKIVSILRTKVGNNKDYTYLGNMLVNRRPMDHGKWRQNPLVYAEEFYPKYAAGPGYILRRDLIEVVFKDHYDENVKLMLDNEDVNIGVWVDRANSSGIPVDYQHLEANEEECKPKDSLAMNLDLGVISCMWSRQMAGEVDTCCGHEKFDWRMRADALEGQASFLRGQARKLHADPSEGIFHAEEKRLHSSKRHRRAKRKHRRAHRTLRTRSK